jgi:dienelactone hydrolase
MKTAARLCVISMVVVLLAAPGAAANKRQYAQWSREIKQALFVPDPLPSLAPQSFGTFEAAGGVTGERITYTTAYGMRVPAILYRPQTHRGKLPGLVVVNGHGGDKYSWYAVYAGILYARLGAVVLTYDPIGEGERNIDHKSATRAHDQLVEPAEMGRRLGGLMITDEMQAVSYLAQRHDVDARRIGIMGYSMGSFVSLLAGAADPRAHVMVLSGGGTLDGPGGYWDSGKQMCQGIPYKALAFLGDRPAAIYAMNTAHAKLLVMNGLADTTIDIPHHGPDFFRDLESRTRTLRGVRKDPFETVFIPQVGHRPSFVTRTAALWLNRQLHLKGTTQAQIEAMPETHIAEWVQATHADMEMRFADEAREAGVRALGAGFPAPSRETLTVVPMAEWVAHRDDFIYDSWVKRAQAELGRNAAIPLPAR